jgi:hypothetical protein
MVKTSMAAVTEQSFRTVLLAEGATRPLLGYVKVTELPSPQQRLPGLYL